MIDRGAVKSLAKFTRESCFYDKFNYLFVLSKNNQYVINFTQSISLRYDATTFDNCNLSFIPLSYYKRGSRVVAHVAIST